MEYRTRHGIRRGIGSWVKAVEMDFRVAKRDSSIIKIRYMKFTICSIVGFQNQ